MWDEQRRKKGSQGNATDELIEVFLFVQERKKEEEREKRASFTVIGVAVNVDR